MAVDFRLPEGTERVRAEAARFLDKHLTEELVDKVREAGSVQLDWDFHCALAQEGWLAAFLPKDQGGAGQDPFELLALFEECARRDAPLSAILPTLFVTYTLLRVGGQELRTSLVPRVLAGEIVFCLGFSEPDSGSDVAAAKTRAHRDGDEWVVNGQKIFTTLAEKASHVFLLTRTNPDVPKHRGLTMFVVPLDSEGIEIRPVHTLGGERTNIVFYTDVRVPDANRVGEVDRGWDVLTVALSLERGIVRLSETDLLLEQVLRWARQPGADGTRPLDDPLVRTRLAKVAVRNEVSKLLRYRTAWVTAQGTVPSVEASMAKLFQTEAFVNAAGDLVWMLGPDGVLSHHEPKAPEHGAVEHAFRHAQVTTIFGGTSEVQRGIIAERGLGLPRARPQVR